MNKFFTKAREGLNSILLSLLFIMILIYFIYHAVSGERGLLAYIQLSKQIETKRNELDIVHSEKNKYERNVKLMREESLDLDLLDEQSRRLLGYGEKEEKVYNIENIEQK